MRDWANCVGRYVGPISDSIVFFKGKSFALPKYYAACVTVALADRQGKFMKYSVTPLTFVDSITLLRSVIHKGGKTTCTRVRAVFWISFAPLARGVRPMGCVVRVARRGIDRLEGG